MSRKEQVLSFIREKRGEWVSGESLSREFKISRTAIWKHIRRLREEGYGIESSPKKGYLFRTASRMLLPNEIREGLETTVFGKGEIFYFKEIDSTNTRAKDLAIKGALEGTLIISETQSGGRGRMGRDWFSPAQEGIYVSLILRPNISPVEAPKITLLTAVAVAEALLSLTRLDISIKWPNDILINRKKIAGILTELSTELDLISYVVVGVGLNANTSQFPPDIRGEATSVFLETGEYFSRVRFLREYLKQHEKYYDISKKIGFGPVIDRWRELADIIGRRIKVRMLDSQYTGVVEDIDENGELIIKGDEGGYQRVFSGDVTLE